MTAVAAVCVAGAVRRHRYRNRLAGLARSLGLNFHSQDVFDLPARYRQLTLMREGHDARFWDVVGGPTRWGALTCYAFRYEVGFGIERTVRRWRVVVIETDRSWGRFVVRRCSSAFEPGTAWDVVGQPAPDAPSLTAAWSVTSRAEHDVSSMPAGLIAWLDGLQQDVCLELCDGLLAVQVPLQDDPEQTRWLVHIIQQTASRLVEGSAGNEAGESAATGGGEYARS